MAYDARLADRIRQLVASEPTLTEQRMFGGLAFLVGSNMAVAASAEGGILVRVDPGQSDDLLATTPARPMEMRGRPIRGWLRVDAAAIQSTEDLADWVDRGVRYARSLPSKS